MARCCRAVGRTRATSSRTRVKLIGPWTSSPLCFEALIRVGATNEFSCKKRQVVCKPP